MKVLVTGGIRCGKSLYAENLLADASAVTYVTPGYAADPSHDPEWAARVYNHQKRRPRHWTTIETVDIATDDLADPLARQRQITRLQGRRHRLGVFGQTTRAEGQIQQTQRHHRTQRWHGCQQARRQRERNQQDNHRADAATAPETAV